MSEKFQETVTVVSQKQIGLGNIGRRVADIAKLFGCHVIYYSTSGKNSQPTFYCPPKYILLYKNNK